MTDLNTMMREQARNGLQTQLKTAITNGDTEAADRLMKDIEQFGAANAPKAPPFNDTDIKAELNKTEWYGVDPKKSAKVLEYGKTMDISKFASAKAFADALIKSVEADFPAPGKTETDEEREAREAAEADDDKDEGKKTAARKTDAPGDRDALGNRAGTPRKSGPWTKLSDAPADVQKEIKRTQEKFLSSGATKEAKEKFVATALESHYAAHQRKTGKK